MTREIEDEFAFPKSICFLYDASLKKLILLKRDLLSDEIEFWFCIRVKTGFKE